MRVYHCLLLRKNRSSGQQERKEQAFSYSEKSRIGFWIFRQVYFLMFKGVLRFSSGFPVILLCRQLPVLMVRWPACRLLHIRYRRRFQFQDLCLEYRKFLLSGKAGGAHLLFSFP